MSNFKVELKKVVDDSYEVQIGKNLIPELVKDLTGGLAGKTYIICSDHGFYRGAVVWQTDL